MFIHIVLYFGYTIVDAVCLLTDIQPQTFIVDLFFQTGVHLHSIGTFMILELQAKIRVQT